MRLARSILLLSCLGVFVSGCTRAAIKSPEQAMRLSTRLPALDDDLNFNLLGPALEANIQQLRAKAEGTVRFGPREVSRALYGSALEALLAELRNDVSGTAFKKFLSENFEPFEVYGGREWGEIFMTSYFEPVLAGSLRASPRFSQALWTSPSDLVEINLGVTGLPPRGRYLAAGVGGHRLARVEPYPPRAEIDTPEGLKGRAEALAWVDPIDAFMLEVQGSGVVELEGGQAMHVGYASQNGHPYVSIGKFLFDKIPREKMSLQTLEAYLREVGPFEARRLMNLNPSHVFFQRLERAGLTYFGNEVVAGRTVATDATYFPKGALAFLEFEKPVFQGASAQEPTSWRSASRFVLDQDTGGAIRGPGRLDLFWGRGPEAKQSAGVMKNHARLWYFVPREAYLKRLGASPR